MGCTTKKGRLMRVIVYLHYQPNLKWVAGLLSYLERSGYRVDLVIGDRDEDFWDKCVRGAHHLFMWNGAEPVHEAIRLACLRYGVWWSILEVGWFPQSKNLFVDPVGINADSSIMKDSLSWVGRSHLEKLEEFRDSYLSGRRWNSPGKYVLVPLQLDWDTNIKLHSPVLSTQEFIKQTEEKFEGKRVIFKRHPHDTMSYETSQEMVVDGDFIDMAVNAELVYGINSTCLLEAHLMGVPVEAIGQGYLSTGLSVEKLLAALVSKQISVGETDLDCHFKSILSPTRGSVAYVMPRFVHGGAEVNFYRLGKEAVRRGWKVGMFAVSDVGQHPGVDLSWAHESHSQKNVGLAGSAQIGSKLIKLLEGYDFIHVANLTVDHRLTLKQSLSGTFFETFHGVQVLDSLKHGESWDKIDTSFCVTHELCERVGQGMWSANPVEIPETPAPLESDIVTMIGRIDDEKNQIEFVNILDEIGSGVRGVLVGDADVGMENLRKRVEDRALERGVSLTITGWTDPFRWIQQSAVVLHTAQMENQPISLLEAMAHGVPVVAKSVGGIPEMIEHMKNGFLYHDTCWAALWTGTMLANRVRAREVGLEGRRRVILRHNVQTCFRMHQDVYLGSKKEMNSKVSVIVSAYNQKETLKLALESLGLQKELPIEVIVADDGSSDGTLDWLDSIENKYPFSLSYVTREHLGYDLAGLNNLGASKASGDRLLFTNADVIHNPHSILAHCTVEDNLIAGGQVRGISMPMAQEVKVSDVRTFERLVRLHRENSSGCSNEQWHRIDPNVNFYGIWSGNFSVSREFFLRLGGYNEEYRHLYGGEEADLICRIRKSDGGVVWAMGSVGYHLDHPSKGYRRNALGNQKFRREWL